jgi:DNA-binding GntR family transcriptional regulator
MSTSPERLRRRSSGEQVALYIRKLIFDGELRPGMRVPQDKVARQLAVSRIPVREALISLENEGWVTNELHRGAFVNALDEEAVRDHYELFGITYGFAARKATERRGPALARELRRLVKSMAETDQPQEVTTLAIEFHARVVDAARSPRTKVMLRSMAGMLPGDFFELVPGAISTLRRGTTAVTRAIGRGDAVAAGEEYLRMMRREGELVVGVLRERGLLDAGE